MEKKGNSKERILLHDNLFEGDPIINYVFVTLLFYESGWEPERDPVFVFAKYLY